MNDINNNGYLLLKNILTSEQLQSGLNCDNNGTVNYIKMKYFIDNIFLPTISSNTNFIPNPKYVKFRYSNNNNSVDASTFHSDIYNYTSSEIIPIYTCLCYFDKTQMELIPGSHKKQFHSENSSINSYFKKETIDIEPGDILVFNANLYHRGKNFDTIGDRRLLQVFEVFPDENTFQNNYNQFLTVITSNSPTVNLVSQLSYIISKVPLLLDCSCFISYMLVYNDLQYKVMLKDLPPWDKANKLITYEPSKRTNYDKVTGSDPVNVNIICTKSNTTEPSNFYLFISIFFLLISLIIIYYLAKRLYQRDLLNFIFKNNSKRVVRK
jgi:hypothetical protein